MRRRTFLAATAATTLALPGATRAASKKVLSLYRRPILQCSIRS